MKRIIGFALFFIAIGMIIMMFISDIFVGIVFVILLLVLGYNFYCYK